LNSSHRRQRLRHRFRKGDTKAVIAESATEVLEKGTHQYGSPSEAGIQAAIKLRSGNGEDPFEICNETGKAFSREVLRRVYRREALISFVLIPNDSLPYIRAPDPRSKRSLWHDLAEKDIRDELQLPQILVFVAMSSLEVPIEITLLGKDYGIGVSLLLKFRLRRRGQCLHLDVNLNQVRENLTLAQCPRRGRERKNAHRHSSSTRE